MKIAFVAYGGSLVALLAVDAIWLGLVARTFYRDQLGDMMLPSPNLGIAVVFYIFFAAAVVILAVLPALSAGSLIMAIVYGAVLGLAAYGTYEITNLATLRNWPVAMAVIDIGWGTFLTSLTAASGFTVARLFA
ncbi:DUF2177 family protein [Rhizobium sp. Root1220]|uniref:DUF2177 family protein n=1 Tax=Rhizobium sp. Root1220 TaxID=1736432 RepID=UPI0006FC5A85|nr:DUF2177 family protein [Rhizobium sp. Root1220]KQV63880.1 hypothetical protein ASC90_18100 [Rhizobium sp. Root1220]